MPVNARLHPTLPIVEVVYWGVLAPEDLESAFVQAMAISRENDCLRFLADCTALTGGHSVVDLYNLVDALQSSGVAHLLSEAVLVPELPVPTVNVRFWETACQNRGIRVRIFVDRSEALDWLLAPIAG
jgi:hypothetical protein